MSPTLLRFYLADMTRPTEPDKWICYADYITGWASGVSIPGAQDQRLPDRDILFLTR